MKLDTLIGIPEAARLARVPRRTMLDRLKKLDKKLRESGDPPILIRLGERVWKVRAEALREALFTREKAQAAVSAQSERIDSVESRLSDVSDKVSALRNSHLAERRRQKNRWELQSRINRRLVENQADISTLRDM